jgi:ribosomal protein L37AE/L43A
MTTDDLNQAVERLREFAAEIDGVFYAAGDGPSLPSAAQVNLVLDILERLQRAFYLPLPCPVCKRQRLLARQGQVWCEKCEADNAVLRDAAEAAETRLERLEEAAARLYIEWDADETESEFEEAWEDLRALLSTEEP